MEAHIVAEVRTVRTVAVVLTVVADPIAEARVVAVPTVVAAVRVAEDAAAGSKSGKWKDER